MNNLVIEAFFALFVVGSTFFGTKYLLQKTSAREYIIHTPWLHPNAISYFRIPLGVLSMVLFHYDFYLLAIILFSFAAITDAVDGMIARACNLMTKKGKSLDPLADKLVYFAPLIYFSYIGKIHLLLVILFILIDSIGQYSRVILKKLKRETKANNYGKIKTTFVFILIFYLLIFENKNIIHIDSIFTNICMGVGILFSGLSLVFKFIKK